jgi:hypothetical protein
VVAYELMVKELEVAARGGGVAVGTAGSPPSSPSPSLLPAPPLIQPNLTI